MNISSELQIFQQILGNYYSLLFNSWYILLPLAFLLLVASRFSSKVTVFFIGFYTSYTIIIPYVLNLPFVGNYLENNKIFGDMTYFIVSIIIGVIFNNLVKSGLAIIGFLLGGIFGYSVGTAVLASNIPLNLGFDKIYIPWIGFIAVGLILSLVINKSFEMILAALSVTFGSILLSIYTLYGLEKIGNMQIGNNSLLSPKFSVLSMNEVFAVAASFVIFCLIGFYIYKKKK